MDERFPAQPVREECGCLGLVAQGATQKTGVISTEHISASTCWMAAEDCQAAIQFPVRIAKPEGVQISIHGSVWIWCEPHTALPVGQTPTDAKIGIVLSKTLLFLQLADFFAATAT